MNKLPQIDEQEMQRREEESDCAIILAVIFNLAIVGGLLVWLGCFLRYLIFGYNS